MLRAKYVNKRYKYCIYIEAIYRNRGGGLYQIFKHEAEPSV